ncbi:MAG TPA: hypothetical protein VM076_05110 [Gemmatimonadaceae bacterium]|nr:hypothetical protein [Gemmatimonadaceae bacterium]
MPAYRFAIIALFTAFATGACGDGAPVAPHMPNDREPTPAQTGRDNQTVMDQDVSISIPYDAGEASKRCGLRTRVDGSGVLRLITKAVENGSGTAQVTISITASGTATGTDGSIYIWSYARSLRASQATGLPTTFRIADQFDLMERDGASSYKVAFHLTVALDPSGVPTSLEYGKEPGDFGQCDRL